MKKLLLFGLIMFQVGLKSQTNVYHPFPVDTAVWLEDFASNGCGGYCYSTRTVQMGDTLISSILYKKLYQQTGTYQMNGSTGPPNYTPIFAFNPNSTNNYIGALRQDSLAKKVYYYPSSGTSNDTLLYDFDLQVGDTLPPSFLPYYMPSAGGTNPSTVKRIDSILIDNSWRITFIFDTSSVSSQFTYLIEGIGNSWGPLWSYAVFFEHGSTLRCFNHNEVGAGWYPNVCMGLTVGVSEIVEKNAFIVRPNPFSDRVTVLCPYNCYEIKISDLLGRTRAIIIPQGSEENIDLTRLEKGIYFITLKTPESYITRKIIKQ